MDRRNFLKAGTLSVAAASQLTGTQVAKATQASVYGSESLVPAVAREAS
ncbi:MAG: twin-arginine translocation signal domain-containing protein [Planctomycetaceae bacterium]